MTMICSKSNRKRSEETYGFTSGADSKLFIMPVFTLAPEILYGF